MIKTRINNEYKDIIKIFGGGTLQKEIIKVWSREAQEYVYESSVEYTGVLPITISTNGNALIDYRIYGASGGVGEPTENLFNENATDISKGYIDNGYITNAGTVNGHVLYRTTEFIKIVGGETYTLKDMNINANLASVCFYTTSSIDAYISGIAYSGRRTITFETPANSEYLRFSFLAENSDIAMLTESSTAPTEYIPYGYKLPMTVQSANLFDKDARDPDNGFVDDSYLSINGIVYNNPNCYISEYIEIESISSITFAFASILGVYTCFYNSEKQITGSYDGIVVKNVPMTVTVPSSAKYMRISVLKSYENIVCVVEGSTAPTEYIPYSKQTVPIYIGSDPLGEDEYVDYGEQKVYKRTENLLNTDRIESRTFTTNTKYYLYGAGADSKNLQIDKIVSASITKNYVEVYSSSGVGIGYIVNVKPNTTYTISYDLDVSVPNDKSSAAVNTISNNNVLGSFAAIYGNINKHTITTLQNTKYLFIVFRVVNVKAIYTNIVLAEGSTAPETYIPYLQPQDPPVPFTAIPTIEGETVIDYDGDPKPSQMYVKYRR